MAKMVLKSPYILVGDADLSSYVRKLTINYEADEVEATCSGDAAHNALAGLKNWSVDVEFAQDYDTAKVDPTIWALVGVDAGAALTIRPASGASSATNPKWTGTGRVFGYSPLSGGPGDLASTSVTFKSNGSDLVRATSD